jgi:hypothetical protein
MSKKTDAVFLLDKFFTIVLLFIMLASLLFEYTQIIFWLGLFYIVYRFFGTDLFQGQPKIWRCTTCHKFRDKTVTCIDCGSKLKGIR